MSIYMTFAVESLNTVIRKGTKKQKVLPDDDAALKVVYLATEAASRKWTTPIRDWKKALNRFVMARQTGHSVTSQTSLIHSQLG